jgi:cysteine-rich repeat protein
MPDVRPVVAAMLLAVLPIGAPPAAATPCTADLDCVGEERCDGAAACGMGTCVPAFTLPRFPLDVAGVTAYTAEIISVLDHAEGFYSQCCGTRITAYTGETVVRGAEVELCPAPPEFPACFFTAGCICGYKHPAGAPFEVNGNYVGALFGPQYLSYDGHAGYDYRYGFATPIVAPRAGLLCKAQEDPINGHLGAPSAWDKFHTFYIDHGTFAARGHATWYLHAADLEGATLQALAPGQCTPVAEGQQVATVGNVGTFAPHLHFEVRRYDPDDGPEAASSRAIDAYGWRGEGSDPWALLENPQAETQDAPLWLACGNARLECGETCDDGNTVDGDCCSASCQVETGTACVAALPANGSTGALALVLLLALVLIAQQGNGDTPKSQAWVSRNPR